MSKMSELHMEVEELLYQGFSGDEVAKMLNIPLSIVIPIEDNMLSANEPRNYGPDYECVH